eukprot:COSAG06_NODE_59055_length_275_cov_0.835227_1_plen_83_part_10
MAQKDRFLTCANVAELIWRVLAAEDATDDLQKRNVFLSALPTVCLSRACLGKRIISFSIKRHCVYWKIHFLTEAIRAAWSFEE